MRYYLRPWDEDRGDKFAGWGVSLWYFETDDSGRVVRQVEAYENGKVLRYDEDNLNDEFGGLAEHPIDLSEFEQFAISKEEFDDRWMMD